MGIEEYKKRPNPDTYRLLADAYQKQGNANLAKSSNAKVPATIW